MTPRQIDRRLGQVDENLGQMADLVAKAIALAVAGLKDPHRNLGTEAKAIEQQVDALDDALEQDCQELMALNAPVASDLRRLMGAMRVTLLLEDLGDEAESVARRGRYLARHVVVTRPPALLALAELVMQTYGQACAVVKTGSVDIARAIFAGKPEADVLGRAASTALGESIRQDGEHTAEWSHLLRATERLRTMLERCKELTEEGYFLHHGTSVRHRHEKLA